MSESKKPLTGLFRDEPETPEGKYLVKRRDGTVPQWPSFVLGGADPIAEVALRAYAAEIYRIMMQDDLTERHQLGLTFSFYLAVLKWADEFAAYRQTHGCGDPGRGKHRVDDPTTVEEMKKGFSA